MIPAHRHKMPTWYHIRQTASPDLMDVHRRISHVSHRTLEHATKHGVIVRRR